MVAHFFVGKNLGLRPLLNVLTHFFPLSFFKSKKMPRRGDRHVTLTDSDDAGEQIVMVAVIAYRSFELVCFQICNGS